MFPAVVSAFALTPANQRLPHRRSPDTMPRDMGSYDQTYNERLFGGRSLRTYLHSARFVWFQDVLKRRRLSARRVVELGCFDGKLLDWMPTFPDHYLGVDANWEKGLDLARERFAGDARVRLIETSDPAAVTHEGPPFDLGVSMESLEHVPSTLVVPYLARLAQLVRGHVLLTVPNELGAVFAAKWLVKRLRFQDAEAYSPREFVDQVRGHTWNVARRDHKGFDYRALLVDVASYFDVLAVESIPFRHAPLAAAFGVGIIARSKNLES